MTLAMRFGRRPGVFFVRAGYSRRERVHREGITLKKKKRREKLPGETSFLRNAVPQIIGVLLPCVIMCNDTAAVILVSGSENWDEGGSAEPSGALLSLPVVICITNPRGYSQQYFINKPGLSYPKVFRDFFRT